MSLNSEIIVEAVGLSKVFKDFWGRPKANAVNQIDFKIKKGQVFGLLGPNGSGKSTTIKMILGLLYPSGGKLQVFGDSPRNVKIKEKIGYLPEETYLYKYLTAAETVDFFGALFNIPSAERKKRCDQLLEMVGLQNVGTRTVGEFSKGMARRIGLAQALINDPDLIVLDEPTSGLDPIGAKDVKELIKLLASRGKTVILTSHLLSDVEDLVDELVVLYGGKIRAAGTAKELLTVDEKTRIVTPSLSPEILGKVMNVLNDTFSEDLIKVDHPSLELEEFFLDVVKQAKNEHVDTAGAQNDGKIADYLKGDSENEKNDVVLESLLKHDLEKNAVEAKETSEEEHANLSVVNEEKLVDLVSSPVIEEKIEASEPETSEKNENKKEELKKASQNIQNLLDKK